MSCRCKYIDCKKYQDKDNFRAALKAHPNLESPLKNWECNESEEKTCPNFKPFPPPMNGKSYEISRIEALKDVPKELHGALSSIAWDGGHSAGYEEVISELSELVYCLEEPLKKLQERIEREAVMQYKKG
jgi:hypothetical protein